MQETPLTSHFPALAVVNLQFDFTPRRGQITEFLCVLENFTSSWAVAFLYQIELIANSFFFFFFPTDSPPSIASRSSCFNEKNRLVTECKDNPLQTMQLCCEACEFPGCSDCPEGFVISHYSLVPILVPSPSARRKLLAQLEPNSCHVWLLCLGIV